MQNRFNIPTPNRKSFEQIIIIMATKNDTKTAAPAATGHTRASPACPTSAFPVVDNLSVPKRGPTKVDNFLKMIDALSSRMERIETSHIRIDEDKRMRGAIESWSSVSALSANLIIRTILMDAIDQVEIHPPFKVSLAHVPAIRWESFENGARFRTELL